jgi:hypothetical protein
MPLKRLDFLVHASDAVVVSKATSFLVLTHIRLIDLIRSIRVDLLL